MTRYIYKVLYRGKEIDKIDTVADNRDIAEDEVNTFALENFEVVFEEEILEEEYYEKTTF